MPGLRAGGGSGSEEMDVLIDPVINATLHSDLPIWIQYLASLSGLSGLVALLALALSYRKKPEIKCSNIRYLILGNSSPKNPSNTYIFPYLTFSNIGNRTGIVETLKLELELESGFVLTYFAYIEPMKPSYLKPENEIPKGYERPVHSFAIPPESSKSKSILFANNNTFRFIKGSYTLKVFYRLSKDNDFIECSKRHIRLDRDLGPEEWPVSSDPLGTSDVFDFPLMNINTAIKLYLYP